jgi:hypothetical protein
MPCLRASSVMGMPEIAFVADGKNLYIRGVNRKDATAGSYSVEVGETDRVFNVLINLANAKMMIKDYTVSISQGIVRFVGPGIVYFVAPEAASSYGK